MIFFLVLNLLGKERVKADIWSEPVEFYRTYGNNAVFHPLTQRDGEILFATSAGIATGSEYITFRTIGWQFVIVDLAGKTVQSINYTLGGNFLKIKSCVLVGQTEYSLYTIKLNQVKEKLTTSNRQLLDSGKAKILLNACVVVNYFGTPSGSMTADGTIKGNVYTTYQGITGAVAWPAGTKEFLKSYYGKEITGLYRKVTLIKGTGIDKVEGSGMYCYGSFATLRATPSYGYNFAYWSGSSTYTSSTQKLTISSDLQLTAYASQKYAKVSFWRNQSASDMEKTSQTYYYAKTGQKFPAVSWIKEGYQLGGWSASKENGKADYSLQNAVNGNWIVNHSPECSLYAAWRPNTYQIAYELFDGGQTIPVQTSDYESVVTLPKDLKRTTTGLGILFWTTSEDGTGLVFSPGEQVEVSLLARSQDKSTQNGATLKLYARWKSEPYIEASDIYVSLDMAQNGVVTEEYLFSCAQAFDEYDGEIMPGVHEKNRFVLENFEEEDYLQLTGNAIILETFVATNEKGLEKTKSIQVHVVKTQVEIATRPFEEHIRFIDLKYLQNVDGTIKKETDGGLREDSVWKSEPTYLSELTEAVYLANESLK